MTVTNDPSGVYPSFLTLDPNTLDVTVDTSDPALDLVALHGVVVTVEVEAFIAPTNSVTGTFTIELQNLCAGSTLTPPGTLATAGSPLVYYMEDYATT